MIFNDFTFPPVKQNNLGERNWLFLATHLQVKIGSPFDGFQTLVIPCQIACLLNIIGFSFANFLASIHASISVDTLVFFLQFYHMKRHRDKRSEKFESM